MDKPSVMRRLARSAAALLASTSLTSAQTVNPCPLCSSPLFYAQAKARMFNGTTCASPPTQTPSVGGSTWYVDPVNGSNANAGTSKGAAWATLAYALGTKFPGTVKPGDLILEETGLDPGFGFPSNFNSGGDWLTIAADVGATPELAQFTIRGAGTSHIILEGFFLSRYNANGTINTPLDSSYSQYMIYVNAVNNVMFLNNTVQTAPDSLMYPTWTEANWVSNLKAGNSINFSSCIIVTDTYNNVGGNSPAIAIGISSSNNVGVSAVVNGYAGDGIHTDTVKNVFVVGSGLFNVNSITANHNDFIQIGTTTKSFDAYDILLDHNIAIRDTGVGKVLYNDGNPPGGTQGFDSDGTTQGVFGYQITNNYICSSGGVAQLATTLGDTVGTYFSGNVIVDDGVLANTGGVPSAVTTNGSGTNALTVINNSSPYYYNYTLPGLTNGGNACTTPPAGRAACNLVPF